MVSSRNVGDIVVIDLSGWVNDESVATLQQLVQSQLDRGWKKILLHFPSGLRVEAEHARQIVLIAKNIGSQNGYCQLWNAHKIKPTTAACILVSGFNNFQDESTAVRSFP